MILKNYISHIKDDKEIYINRPPISAFYACHYHVAARDRQGTKPKQFLQWHLTTDCTLNLMVNRLNARIHHSFPHWLGFKTQTTVRGMAQWTACYSKVWDSMVHSIKNKPLCILRQINTCRDKPPPPTQVRSQVLKWFAQDSIGKLAGVWRCAW